MNEQIRFLRDELQKERRKNLGLERQIEALHKAKARVPKEEKAADKFEGLKAEYRQLLDAFEKSEKIRREQKMLI